MHEFGSVQEAIIRLRKMRPLPRKVRITLGKMRGSVRGFEEMLRENIRDTELEGLQFETEHIPVEIRCPCGLEGMVRIMEHVHYVRCPKCGQVADVLKGNELNIEVLE